MSLHASHTASEELPEGILSILAQSYKSMLDLQIQDVHALRALYRSTEECQDEACVQLRSMHDDCCKGDITPSAEVLSNNTDQGDSQQQSLGLAARYGLVFASRGDLRQDWRLKEVSQTVSNPSLLDAARANRTLHIIAINRQPENAQYDANNPSGTTLEEVDMYTLLEYDILQKPITSAVANSTAVDEETDSQ